MAQSTASRARGRSRTRPSRSPELDMARAVALVAAVVVLVAPGQLPPWLDGRGLTVATVLPAAFATVAGVAISHQRAAHGSATAGWWTGRITRRVVALVAVGLLLQLLVLLPDPAQALTRLRFTGDLARIGVATGLGLLLVRLPARTQGAVAVALAGAHAMLVLGASSPAATGGALGGWDVRLLGGRAIAPVDPDGVTALAPTIALVLAGVAIGDWLRSRPRGAGTVARLLAATAAVALAARLLARVLPVDVDVWTPPVLLGGIATTLLLLAVGQAGTRRPLTDRFVATLAVAGRVTLPLWCLAVVGHAWLGGSPPLRWIVREVLYPPLGSTGAAAAFGLLVAAALLRLGAVLSDRGHDLRA